MFINRRVLSGIVLFVLAAASSLRADLVMEFTCADHGTGCTNLIPAGAPSSTFGSMDPSSIIVPDLGPDAVLLDIDVAVKIQHTWRGDLRVFLTDPVFGFSRELFSDLGGSANDGNDVDVTLDDEATLNIAFGDCADENKACIGTFRPEGPVELSIFDGINPAGPWSLSVADTGTGDTGGLQGWKIRLTLQDSDDDGLADGQDNCRDAANPDQLDADSDGVGDACDLCLNTPDPDQLDQDHDSVGDGCDLCPTVDNPDQADPDADGQGSPCDNCPSEANFDQADRDADGAGDLCDADPDDPAITDPPTGGPPAGLPNAEECGACGTGSASALITATLGLTALRSTRRRPRINQARGR